MKLTDRNRVDDHPVGAAALDMRPVALGERIELRMRERRAPAAMLVPRRIALIGVDEVGQPPHPRHPRVAHVPDQPQPPRRGAARARSRRAQRGSRTSGTPARRPPRRRWQRAAGIACAMPASTVTSGCSAAIRARIAATGSTASNRAPVARNGARNLPVPAPRSITVRSGPSARSSRSHPATPAGIIGAPRRIAIGGAREALGSGGVDGHRAARRRRSASRVDHRRDDREEEPLAGIGQMVVGDRFDRRRCGRLQPRGRAIGDDHVGRRRALADQRGDQRRSAGRVRKRPGHLAAAPADLRAWAGGDPKIDLQPRPLDPGAAGGDQAPAARAPDPGAADPLPAYRR